MSDIEDAIFWLKQQLEENIFLSERASSEGLREIHKKRANRLRVILLELGKTNYLNESFSCKLPKHLL